MKLAPKIVVAGLRKAGKTTAIRSFFDSWDKDKLRSIRPTVDYSIFNSFLEEIKSELTIFDLGGQDQYIKKHLIDVSKWKGASAIIFVVDMHKPGEFGAANQYLNEIMSIVRDLGESPFIGLFAHKYDPDKVGDLQLSLTQFLKTFKGLFKWSKYSVFMSSIYDDSLYLAFMRTLIRIIPRDLLNRILGSAIFFETQNRVWKTISEDLSPEHESHEFWNKIVKLSVPYGENLANKIFREWLSGQMDETVNKEITELIRIKIEDIAGGMKANITLPREGSSLLIVAVIEGLLTGLGNVFGFSRIIRLHVDQTPGDIATSWGLYEF
jgi:GTPase SAR1 family protein